jgi:pyridoxal phosphate enzyme (YggS family)
VNINPDTDIALRFDSLSKRIEQAARRSGRSPGDITFVAVSKGVEPAPLQEAIHAGIKVFGENRVAEAIHKFSERRESISLHLVGSLQTNKVKKAVGFFDLIHSIDSIHLAHEVALEAARQSIVQPVLVQVNVAQEATKRGVSLDDAPRLVEAVRQCPSLRLLGLMTIPPQQPDAEGSRPYFIKLRECGVAMGLFQFSMGMSDNFDVAIEEGATWVRIGTALFGERPTVGAG